MLVMRIYQNLAMKKKNEQKYLSLKMLTPITQCLILQIVSHSGEQVKNKLEEI